MDPESQADPKFQTPLAYTRMTAASVRQALVDHKGYAPTELPSKRTMRRILNRLGYCLRRVQKTKPAKKIKETDAIFENVKRANQQADEDPACLRISLDSKAKLRPFEQRLHRSETLPKWSAMIFPQPGLSGSR